MSERFGLWGDGEQVDWGIMSRGTALLESFGVPNETRVLSAHRAPTEAGGYAGAREARGVEVAASATAHLDLQGLDAPLATVQMPGGIPVGTLGIGKAGADNAALLAAQILSNKRPELREAVRASRKGRAEKVLAETLP